MKQHITIQQLNELSDKRKDKLRAWWKPAYGDCCMITEAWMARNGESGIDKKEYWINDVADYEYSMSSESVTPEMALEKEGIPLLSIGQMISFLYENTIFPIESITLHTGKGENETAVYAPYYDIEDDEHHALYFTYTEDNVCDALWETVKEILKK